MHLPVRYLCSRTFIWDQAEVVYGGEEYFSFGASAEVLCCLVFARVKTDFEIGCAPSYHSVLLRTKNADLLRPYR